MPNGTIDIIIFEQKSMGLEDDLKDTRIIHSGKDDTMKPVGLVLKLIPPV